MKNKKISIFVCILLIATTVQTVTSMKNTKMNSDILSDLTNMTISDISSLENWTEIQKLLASDGAQGDNFGISISLDGNSVVIGAYRDNSYRGAAYVFVRSGTTWTQQAKLTASDGVDGDEFGCSVSLDGDYVVIGAASVDLYRGAAYIFVRSGTIWMQQAKLTASDGVEWDFFGESVSLSGDTVVIGAGQLLNSGTGAAYVFTRVGTTWTQQAKLTASDGASENWFGFSVSLDGDSAIIGAIYANYKGAAYIFTRSGTTWTQQAKLTASDGESGDEFGFSVSLDGDSVAVGADCDKDNGYDSGSSYIFTRSGITWTQQTKLTASDGATSDAFGSSVSLSGDSVVIGANQMDNSGNGAAYIFTRSGTTWTQQAKLTASDGASENRFGFSVSLDDNSIVIGAFGYDSYRGAAYFFTNINQNQPPNTPTITGPAKGKIKVATPYNFTTSDPDGDDISYYIDWGDSTNSGWIGPYSSGDTVVQSHTWTKKGDYTIKAKAKDVYGNESDWAMLSVTMPCSYNLPFQPFWERIFERFPNTFPILRYLLGFN
jgi:hypothetical protein